MALRAALVVAFVSPCAWAAPQWNLAIVPGVALVGREASVFDDAVFWGALRGDLLLTRTRATDLGFGPYLMLATAGFGDARLSTGASLLLPWIEDFPLVVSAGGLMRDAEAFGVDGSVFWGLRSYNFHGSYNLTGGLLVGAQRTFGSASDTALTLGVQVDAFVLAIPFLLLAGALG